MRRLLWVARHEYVRHARRRGFLLATIGLPLLVIGGMALLTLVLFNTFRPEAALGYVDPVSLLEGGTLPAPSEGESAFVPLRPFPNEAAARAALDAGTVDAYIVIPAEYPATGALTVYGPEPLSSDGRETLQAALDRGLLARSGVAADAAARVLDPLGEVEARRPDGAPISPQLLIAHGAVALLGSLLFVVTVFSSASYLLQALVEEKENRTIEIVTTSITPVQLIGGKTLGLGLLGLTIALVWVVGVGVAWMVARAFFAPLGEAPLPLGAIALTALLLPLGYLLFAGIMVAISAVVTSAQEGQQFAGVASLLSVLPLMLSGVLIADPDGPIATALSLFPLSAPVAMQLRLVTGSVPLWQLVLSVGLLAAAAGLVVWGAARVFRAGMLSYGKRLSLRDTLRALRAG